MICPVTGVFIQGMGFGLIMFSFLALIFSIIALRSGKVTVLGLEFLEEDNFKTWIIKKLRGDD